MRGDDYVSVDNEFRYYNHYRCPRDVYHTNRDCHDIISSKLKKDFICKCGHPLQIYPVDVRPAYIEGPHYYPDDLRSRKFSLDEVIRLWEKLYAVVEVKDYFSETYVVCKLKRFEGTRIIVDWENMYVDPVDGKYGLFMKKTEFTE